MVGTISARYEISGFGGWLSISIPLPEEMAAELLRRIDRLSPEKKKELRELPVDIKVDLAGFRDLLRRNFGRLQIEPIMFESVATVLNALRELARKDERVRPHINEIDSTGDGKPPSQCERMRLFMEALGVSPDMVWIQCPN